MNAVDTVTSETSEAIGQLVAVAVDPLHEDEMEIDHALDLAIETLTGAAPTAAVIEVETEIVVMHTARAADLPLDHGLAGGPGTVHAHARGQLLPDGARVLDPLHEEDRDLGAVPARGELRGRDAHPLALATLIATFLPTATGALHLGAESDLRSVMLGPPGLVILTVTFPALSRQRLKRGSLNPQQRKRRKLMTVGLDDAAAVVAGVEGVPVGGEALVGVEVEVVAGVAAGEQVEVILRGNDTRRASTVHVPVIIAVYD
jgi:hypothetical protein